MNVLSQIIGLIAIIAVFISYQQKEKSKFLYIQIFANIFYGIQYGLLNAFSAVAMDLVSILRSIIFYRNEKKNKETSLFILIVLEIIIILFGIVTYKGFISLMPIFIAAIFAYGTWQKNLKLTYFIGIITSIIWIWYNIVIGAYVSLIGNTFEFTASTMGFIKLLKYNKKKEAEQK
jgi:hypothetical protein